MGQPVPRGAPEGTRAAQAIRRPSHAGPYAVLALLCALFAVAIGDETASLIVTNVTPHVVDVVVADQTFPHLAPGARATYQSSGPATVKAKVTYAAGQGIEGSAERSFLISPYHPPGSSTGYVYWGCTMGGTIMSPASGGPMMWEVTADTLARR